MVVKAILLDLDGTLINSVPLITQSVDKAIKHFGFSCSKQKLRDLSNYHSRDIAYYFMDKHKVSFDVHAFVEYRRKVFVELLEKNCEKLWFKDSKSFLELASKHVKIGIVTGSRWAFVKPIMDEKTLNLIDFIITSDDVEHKKPDIEPLEKMLFKLKLKKDDCVFIGDSIHDGLMCQRYNVSFIAKLGGISTEKQLRKYKPIAVVKNFGEVIDLLNIQ